jgi:hypothetical protein
VAVERWVIATTGAIQPDFWSVPSEGIDLRIDCLGTPGQRAPGPLDMAGSVGA